MQYRELKNQDHLSLLGFGCMRFPKKGTGFDMNEVEREIMYAIEHGVTYFDTAYIYPGSEEALGTVLAKNHCRDQITIASKLPHYMIKTLDDAKRIFEEECKRLQTDHIDYYLMHMLTDVKTWNRLRSIGLAEWLEDMRKEGRIGRIGFSYHGCTAEFLDLLNAYDWEFCQIQYNYMDENSQAGRKGLKAAAQKGIPVIIMEPLRGGKLVNHLPAKALEAFGHASVKRSPADWALRWLWDQPEVSVVLSGMNSMEMVKENIRIASEVSPDALTDEDKKLYEAVKAAIGEKTKVPCTGCAYCMPCPKGVDIPGSFQCYNMSYAENWISGIREYIMCTVMRGESRMASQCIECGKCEQHCPQHIEVRKQLKQVQKRFDKNLIFRATAAFMRKRYQ